MKLRALEISNFKSFKHARFENLNLINAITGPNNEGKSSVLEAISTLGHRHSKIPSGLNLDNYLATRSVQTVGSGGFTISVEMSPDRSDFDSLGIDQTRYLREGISGVRYELAWSKNISIKNRENNQMVPTSVSVIFEDGRSERWSWIHQGDVPELRIIGGGLEQVLEGGGSRVDATNVTTAFTSGGSHWEVLKILDCWAQKLVWIPIHRQVNTDGQLMDEGALASHTIASNLLRIKARFPARYDEFESVLHALVPTVLKIYVIPESGTDLTIRVSESEIDHPDEALRLDHVGGGVSELLYLISGIWLAPDGSTILVEEPERGLHPGAQRTLLMMARDHCKKHDKQVFWTTHSTVMAPVLSDVSSTLVSFGENSRSRARSILAEDVEAVRKSLGITPSDLYLHRLILLTDGETEIEFFRDVIQGLFGIDRANGIYVKPLGGDINSKKDHVARTISLVASSSTEIFIFADHDGPVETALEWISNSGIIPTEFDIRTRVHVWECSMSGSGRDAEFENNFSTEELVSAANKQAPETKLVASDLDNLLGSKTHLKISKVLADYYRKTYDHDLNKPDLGRELALTALAKIRADENRGTAEGKYEFEVALDRAMALIE